MGRAPTVPSMTRVIRTLIAVLVAVPTAVGTLAAAGVPVPAEWVALITGSAGAIVVLVTAAWNGAEDKGVVKDRRI